MLLKHTVFYITILQPQQYQYILDLVEYSKIVATFATEINVEVIFVTISGIDSSAFLL